MTLIAVPFAVTIGRSGAMAGIGVGIGIALAYWTTILFFAAIGSGGLLTPMLAAWAPNLLFGAGAAYLLLDRQDLTAQPHVPDVVEPHLAARALFRMDGIHDEQEIADLFENRAGRSPFRAATSRRTG